MPDAPATPTSATPFGGTPLASRSPQTILVDNVLRRELRIADPSDPAQVSAALLNLYPQHSDQMARERAGFSYSAAPTLAPAVPAQGGATSSEIVEAQSDLDRDIDTLSNSSELKDLQIELQGWGRAVRQAATDGLAAGPLALDMIQFDRAMSARRTLEDYARMSRFVGAMSGDTSPYFRHFAQSCDVIGGLILVSMGEGLAANGVTRGSQMIRVSAGDLQSRRNAVVFALRSLVGSVEAPLDGGWPRGPESYRVLVRHLENSGQTDLRTLLDEGALSAALDQLVDLATGATSAGLRELSSASAILVQRLQQLVQYGQTVSVTAINIGTGETTPRGTPESPLLAGFVSALQLFIDAFTTRSSGRLLYLARPPMVTYGLYGMTGPDAATLRLIGLANLRGQLAERIDFYADVNSDNASALTTVLLDLLLYRVDRAIDFYAVGVNPAGTGDAEIRAAATGILIYALLWPAGVNPGPAPPGGQYPPAGQIPQLPMPQALALDPLLTGALTQIDLLLLQPLNILQPNILPPPPGGGAQLNVPGLQPNPMTMLIQELSAQFQAEHQINRIVQSLSPAGRVEGTLQFQNRAWGGVGHQLSIAQDALYLALDALGYSTPSVFGGVTLPPTVESSVGHLAFGLPMQVNPTWP
jgi:hypothetical protein